MASRYDTIPKFNPFIQDAPMDLLTQVGLTKQGQYIEGVRQVQEYVDELNRVPLIKDVDKQYMRNKLDQLGQDIAKVAGEDFSNPFLVGKLGTLAHGVYSDPKILNGARGTQKVQEKQALIAQIRAKNPELYNPNNEAYSMIDVNNWLSDNTAGTPLVDNHNYYNYYDVSKELRDAMKNFKPSRVKTKTAEGEWMVTKEDQSYTEAELKEYLNGTLSDRAKQQLRIDGTVSFIGRDDALLGTYYATLKDNLKTNNGSIDQLKARVLALKGDPEKAQILSDKIRALQDQNLEYIDQIGKIDNQDLAFFASSKEGIAEWLYKSSYIDGVARGYSHVDVDYEYDANEVWKTKFQQSMENARQNARLQFEASEHDKNRGNQRLLKLMDLGLLDANGKPIGTSAFMLKAPYNASESDLTTRGREAFENEYNIIEQETADNYNLLREQLLAGDPQLRQQHLNFVKKGGKSMTPTDPVTVYMNQYLDNELKKPALQRASNVNDFVNKQQELATRHRVLDQKREQIEYKVSLNSPNLNVANEMRSIFGKKQSAGIKILTTGPSGQQQPVTLTAEDVINSMTDDNTGLKINRQTTRAGDVYTITRNGKPVGTVSKASPNTVGGAISTALGFGGESPEYREFERIYNAANHLMKDKNSELSKAIKYRNQLYSEAVVNMGDWWTPVSKKDPRVTNTLQYMQQNFGGAADEWDVSMVNQSTGEVKVRVNPKTSAAGKDRSTVDRTRLEASGAKYDPVNDAYTIPSGIIPGFVRQGLENMSTLERTLVKSLDVNQNIPLAGYYTPESSYDPNGNGQFIRIIKESDGSGGYKYFLFHEDSRTRIDKQDLYDPVSAINAAKALTADKRVLQDIIRLNNPNYIVK